jgi:membrane protein implicated in regulation of membrane protease activity
VVTKIRFSYDAMVAAALTTAFALVFALIAAVIVGSNAPNLPVAIVVFLLVAAIQIFRWRRGWQRSASHRVLWFPVFDGN